VFVFVFGWDGLWWRRLRSGGLGVVIGWNYWVLDMSARV
jgi:hypothetical protein